ncbi:conserved hypothetical protein [Burkholderiales bacterium]|nr:conserved hypothetical protein [Burkholderiales bacterium]
MVMKQWEGHLEAAGREGKSVRQYAAEHGLSADAMYSARRKLRMREAMAATKAPVVRAAPKNPFAAVKLAPLGAPLRAQLPNGVMLELAIGAGDSAMLVTAIDVLAKLPCSA